MRFRFTIIQTDKDYLDYNVFWMIRSPYGKRQTLTTRIVIAALFIAVALLSLFSGGLSASAFIGIIPYLILLAVFQLLLNPILIRILKGNIKSLKKKGKMGYSPRSEMEFYEEYFIETTDTNRTEQKYSSVERVSILRDKVVYIHVNNVMSYILPMSCFESKEQYDSFIEFITAKSVNVDVY